MDCDEIRLLPFYTIPREWKVHMIDRRTLLRQIVQAEKMVESATLLAFDTETMPIFYHPTFQQNQQYNQRYPRGEDPLASTTVEKQVPLPPPPISYNGKPSLLQVALRGKRYNMKNVLLFDLQELFDQQNPYYRPTEVAVRVQRLITLIFSHSKASKLSHSLATDLAQLKCSYDDECFQTPIISHLIELSSLYRTAYPPTQKDSNHQTCSLQKMTATVLHLQLNKKYQCVNWSKRPLPYSWKDYAAADVIVMIEIYDSLLSKIKEIYSASTSFDGTDNVKTKQTVLVHDLADPFDESSSSLEEDKDKPGENLSMCSWNWTWSTFQQSFETTIDLTQVKIYQCYCSERFVTSKARSKHAKSCVEASKQNSQYSTQQNDPIVNNSELLHFKQQPRKKKKKKIIIAHDAKIKPKQEESDDEDEQQQEEESFSSEKGYDKMTNGNLTAETYDNMLNISPLSLTTYSRRGRGFIPPGLKKAYEDINSPDHELCHPAPQIQSTRYENSRPPDAKYFLNDEDNEVAQIFGFDKSSSTKYSHRSTNHVIQKPPATSQKPVMNSYNSTYNQQQNKPKIAQFPPAPKEPTYHSTPNDLIIRPDSNRSDLTVSTIMDKLVSSSCDPSIDDTLTLPFHNTSFIAGRGRGIGRGRPKTSDGIGYDQGPPIPSMPFYLRQENDSFT